MLDVLFALNGLVRGFMDLIENQPVNSILLRVTVNESILVLVNPSDKIVCHPDV